MFKHKWLAGVLLVLARIVFIFDENDETDMPQEDMELFCRCTYFLPERIWSKLSLPMDEIDRRIKDIPQVRIFSKVTGNGMISGQGARTVCLSFV